MEFCGAGRAKLVEWNRAERRLKSPLAIGANGRMVEEFFDWPHADLIQPPPRNGRRSLHTLWGCYGFDPWFACAAALGG